MVKRELVEVRVEICRHFQDIKDLINLDLSIQQGIEISDHLNYAKFLLTKYPDTSVEVERKELETIWKDFTNDYNRINK